jgi:pyridoxine 5-phosphate synthase
MRLGVNIDHVATLRQARGGEQPDPLEAAYIAEDAGADGITVHLREDRRHIQDADVERLRARIRTRLNLEMAATDAMVAFACSVRPDDVCLVPERRRELTTEGGLDVVAHEARVCAAVQRLTDAGIRVATFIAPVDAQVRASHTAGVHAVELHTGDYASAATASDVDRELSRLARAAETAHAVGLEVHAGHGLTVGNVRAVAALLHVVELNIGHSIIARAVFVGLSAAVCEMREALK